MLSERPWKVEAVAVLLAALMLGLYSASLINIHLAEVLRGKSIWGIGFIQVMINTFTFFGLWLILIHVFLKYHRVGWSEFLGLNKFPWKAILGGLVAAVAALPLALGLKSLCAA